MREGWRWLSDGEDWNQWQRMLPRVCSGLSGVAPWQIRIRHQLHWWFRQETLETPGLGSDNADHVTHNDHMAARPQNKDWWRLLWGFVTPWDEGNPFLTGLVVVAGQEPVQPLFLLISLPPRWKGPGSWADLDLWWLRGLPSLARTSPQSLSSQLGCFAPRSPLLPHLRLCVPGGSQHPSWTGSSQAARQAGRPGESQLGAAHWSCPSSPEQPRHDGAGFSAKKETSRWIWRRQGSRARKHSLFIAASKALTCFYFCLTPPVRGSYVRSRWHRGQSGTCSFMMQLSNERKRATHPTRCRLAATGYLPTPSPGSGPFPHTKGHLGARRLGRRMPRAPG